MIMKKTTQFLTRKRRKIWSFRIILGGFLSTPNKREIIREYAVHKKLYFSIMFRTEPGNFLHNHWSDCFFSIDLSCFELLARSYSKFSEENAVLLIKNEHFKLLVEISEGSSFLRHYSMFSSYMFYILIHLLDAFRIDKQPVRRLKAMGLLVPISRDLFAEGNMSTTAIVEPQLVSGSSAYDSIFSQLKFGYEGEKSHINSNMNTKTKTKTKAVSTTALCYSSSDTPRGRGCGPLLVEEHEKNANGNTFVNPLNAALPCVTDGECPYLQFRCSKGTSHHTTSHCITSLMEITHIYPSQHHTPHEPQHTLSIS